MSENTEEQEQILFLFKKCQGLRGSGKGNVFTLVVKVEFGNNVLGESGKIEVPLENVDNPLELDFSCHMNVSISDPLVFDEIAQKPVVVTFTEILPKDKKAKEEKTLILGQCCVDLLPLLKGERQYASVNPIFPANPAVELIPQQTIAEVEIDISTPKPLFTEEKLNSSNIITFCVESLFSLPETWNQNPASYMYNACLPIPIQIDSEDQFTQLLIPKGVYRSCGEKEVSEQRKWSYVPSASGCCLYIPDTAICQSSFAEEDGELKGADDAEFRQDAEYLKPKVTWNSEGRCFMFSEAIETLQQKIAHYRYWPLEIIRTCLGNVKTKGKEEEALVSYHGVVYIDLAPLLYPGVNKIRGAYCVHPFNETELEDKLAMKSCLDEKTMKKIIGSTTSLSQLTNPKQPPAGGKNTRAETRVKQSVANIKDGNDIDLSELATQESHEFIEARTYILIEIALEKPLVEKRKPSEIAARVAELIPPRLPYQKKQCGSKKAIEDFEKQIFSTANVLLEEFRNMFGSNLSDSNEDADERRKAFLYDLNSSGKYFAIKEQLKYYVIKLVREKFMYTTSFESKEELQEFISNLYQFLLDKTHCSLNKYLSTEETTEVPPKVADSSMLLHFAKEAEVMFEFDLADKYYQERIVRYKNDAECWFDYGIYNLLIENLQKAEQCFKEVVSLDQQHMSGILLTGLMCFQNEEYAIAEELLDGVTCLHPNEVIPWTLLGLHFSGMENTIMAERSFNVASKLLAGKVKLEQMALLENQISELSVEDTEEERMSPIREGSPLVDEAQQEGARSPQKEEVEEDHPSIFLLTAKFLLKCHALHMAERALAHELIAKTHGPKVQYLELLAQLQMKQKIFPSALASLEEALVTQHENPAVWALKGHLYYEQKEFSVAKQAYERCLAYTSDAPDIHSIYLRLATIYLENDKKYDAAKDSFLKLCKSSPSCVTWLGAGVACYRLNLLLEAEQALNEANILDNRNPEVWAYLSLVCLKQMRHLEAEQCYKYAIKLGLSNEVLVNEMLKTMVDNNFDSSVL